MKCTAATPVTRLAKRADFVRLTKAGHKHASKSFLLQYQVQGPKDKEGEGQGAEAGVRIGFTVSKKFDARAVYRNRAKRRLKAAVDQFTRLNPQFTAPALNLCFIARAALTTTTHPHLLAEVEKALRAAGCQI
ncbi:MAG: ribonuclease P protein component [Alphaproteobacteria bacterium]